VRLGWIFHPLATGHQEYLLVPLHSITVQPRPEGSRTRQIVRPGDHIFQIKLERRARSHLPILSRISCSYVMDSFLNFVEKCLTPVVWAYSKYDRRRRRRRLDRRHRESLALPERPRRRRRKVAMSPAFFKLWSDPVVRYYKSLPSPSSSVWKRKSSSASFFRLSPELRHMVYLEVLGDHSIEIVSRGPSAWADTPGRLTHKKHETPRPPRGFQTCRFPGRCPGHSASARRWCRKNSLALFWTCRQMYVASPSFG
jgi:hypothetical protein